MVGGFGRKLNELAGGSERKRLGPPSRMGADIGGAFGHRVVNQPHNRHRDDHVLKLSYQDAQQ